MLDDNVGPIVDHDEIDTLDLTGEQEDDLTGGEEYNNG